MARFHRTACGPALAVCVLALGLVLGLAPGRAEALAVFPGAEGFGADTLAGRGGTVYMVTTLADDLNTPPPGSLRECVEATGPRVCVFAVGGAILPDHDGTEREGFTITNPFLTIAGQTAPHPGISILGTTGFIVKTHDVLIQHVRLRPGDAHDGDGGNDPCCRDGFALTGAGGDVYNVLMDHVSVSWAVDENMDVAGSTVDPNGQQASVHDITVRSSISSEAFQFSIHSPLDPNGVGVSHSKGSLVDDGVKKVSFIGNLYVHNDGRNASFGGGVTSVFVNNLVFDWGSQPAWYRGEGGDPNNAVLGITDMSTEGNVYIQGPATDPAGPFPAPFNLSDSILPSDSLYVEDTLWDQGMGPVLYHSSLGNETEVVVDHTASVFDQIQCLILGNCPFISSPTTWVPGLTAMSSSLVEASVLANAGARPADRDAIDQRIIDDVVGRTCLNAPDCIIDSQAEVGGWASKLPYDSTAAMQAWASANYPPTSRTHMLPPNPNADDDMDGYTNLEEWLHFHAAIVENPNADADQDTLSNSFEFDAGTYPDMADSDGDTFDDFAELEAGTDPMDPGSFPVMLPVLGAPALYLLAAGLMLMAVLPWRARAGSRPAR